MDAKIAAAVPLSSPAAAQRCAAGAGLDSGAADAAQSAMPSIALLPLHRPQPPFPPTPLCVLAPHLQSRISTSLTDVTTELGARFRQIATTEGVPAAVRWRSAQFKE